MRRAFYNCYLPVYSSRKCIYSKWGDYMEPLVLKYNNIILRDRIPADIVDHRRWLTTEVAWLEWDAPWEKEDPDFVQKYLARMEQRLHQPLPAIRSTLEICHADGAHIGMVNAYDIDENPEKLAVGITLRESRYWGQSLGSQAFPLWLDYQFKATGRETIFCQTWSGNTRMIKLAEKCGFAECQRIKGIREVRGQIYDALTFHLNRSNFCF